MLKNGIEVFDDKELNPVQAYNLQKKFNQIEDIPDESKTTAVVKDGNVESNSGVGFNYGGFNIFQGDGTTGSTTRHRGLRTRQQLYETYVKMDTNGIIHRALEIVSDEASQKNDDEEVISINTNNLKISDILNKLFFDKLDINSELWSIILETIKMGDNFYKIVPTVKNNVASGIKLLKYLDPSKVEISYKEGRVEYYSYSEDNMTSNKKTQVVAQRYFPWQIVHFKIDNKQDIPYGRSLLFPGIRSYERLTATEDIFLTYSISRAPSRRIFKIDVGQLSPIEAENAVRKLRDSYRAKSVLDEEGNITKLSNIMSITSDLFVPTRDGQAGTNIEILNGDMNMNSNMGFLDGFKKDLIRSFNIPPEYMGETGESGDKSASLSQRDVKFARFVERIQSQISRGLYKIAILELVFNGFTKNELKDFKIILTPPSTIKEVSDISVMNSRIDLVNAMANTNMFPKSYLLKKILKLSDREISQLQFMKNIEDKEANGQENQDNQFNSGGGSMPDMSGAEDFNPPQNGEEFPQENGEENPQQSGEENPPENNEEPPEDSEVKDETTPYINYGGMKCLLENKNDFAKIIKFLSEQERTKDQKESGFIKDLGKIINNSPIKDNRFNVGNSQNPFIFLEGKNEFGGMCFKRHKNLYKQYKGSSTPKIFSIRERDKSNDKKRTLNG